MAEVDWSEIAAEAMERDPRQNPFGYLVGGSSGLDATRVFVWFRSVDDLLKHIAEVEPRIHDVEPGEGLEEFQARVNPILETVRHEGFTDSLRKNLDPTHDGGFVVEWWGKYAALRDGLGEFAREILDEYLGEERLGETLLKNEEDDFVEFLTTFRA